MFMAQILIRNLDDKTVNRLKEVAFLHNRSLEKEAKEILTNATNYLTLTEAKKECSKLMLEFGNQKFSDSTELLAELRRE
jgi:plasmid stability protein